MLVLAQGTEQQNHFFGWQVPAYAGWNPLLNVQPEFSNGLISQSQAMVEKLQVTNFTCRPTNAHLPRMLQG